MPLYLVTKEYADEHTLMHYRTKGSRNGFRRYQYEDGSLTPEGRIHYGVGKPGNVAEKNAQKAKDKAWDLEVKAGKLKSKAVWRKNMRGGFGENRLNKKADKIQRRAEEYRRLGDAIDNASTEKTRVKEVKQEIARLVDMPDGPKKQQVQSAFLKEAHAGWTGPGDEYDAVKAERSDYILGEIDKKSGNWYDGTGVSSGFKRQVDAYRQALRRQSQRRDEIDESIRPSDEAFLRMSSKKREKIRNEIREAQNNDPALKEAKLSEDRAKKKVLSVVLKDIGFPDTPENRILIEPFVFID